MHAYACIRMVKNDRKCFKMIKNILFSSCLREARVRLTYKYEQKLSFLAFRSDSLTLVVLGRPMYTRHSKTPPFDDLTYTYLFIWREQKKE